MIESYRKSRNLIVKGACYLIRDGASISVWSDLWVPWIHGFKPVPKTDSLRHTPLLVSQHFDASNHCWNSRLIYELFDEALAHAILKNSSPCQSYARQTYVDFGSQGEVLC